MATYLFAWNPIYWDWPELTDEIRRLKRRGHVDIGWASGRTRSIEPGSRAFMVRLGTPPKGIIGSGYTLADMLWLPVPKPPAFAQIAAA